MRSRKWIYYFLTKSFLPFSLPGAFFFCKKGTVIKSKLFYAKNKVTLRAAPAPTYFASGLCFTAGSFKKMAFI